MFGPYTDIFLLQAPSLDEGVKLLERANRPGFVLLRENGWVLILAEGPPCAGNRSVLTPNEKFLIRYCRVSDRFWYLNLYHRSALVAGAYWNLRSQLINDRDGSAHDRRKLADLQLPKVEKEFLLRTLGLDESGLAPVNRSLNVDQVEEWLRLPGMWVNYDRALKIMGDGDLHPFGMQYVPKKPPVGPHFSPDRFSLTTEAKLFPKVFCGDTADVRRAAKKFATAIWKTRDWGQVVSALEMAPYDSLSDEVLLDECKTYKAKHDWAWRPYLIADPFREAGGRSFTAQTITSEEYQDTVLEGMKYLWFVLAFLEGPSLDSGYHFSDSPAEKQLLLFKAFVNWLPELLAMTPHFRDFHSLSAFGNIRRPAWVNNIFSTAMTAGYKIPHLELETTYADNWVGALLAAKAVEFVDGRFVALPV